MIPARPPRATTRHRDGLIHAYVVDSGAFGTLEPAAVFRPQAGDEVVGSAVRPDLERVVYTTRNRVVCLTRAGDLVWASAFERHSDVRYGHQPAGALSLDGRTVWVYRPDAMAGRGSADQWVVYDAESGVVLARRELETVGHGAWHQVHPVDGSIYLDIGEGQDDEEEWFRHHLVDLRTGTLAGELVVEATDPYAPELLGDGSWLTNGPAGHPVRAARPNGALRVRP
ncbi:hypothetical protein [Streptomyces noursei]|uniref:Uncharacterized protein n=1 Tax=Streptomyces noursei TaxID=1971 RepID=A0A2N8PJ61_STRNR|nr:hypothetical protein [Streptomyces noursei]PNE41028.1 hypothetical protein AOB60_09820 [Streptomyces noursei]